MKITIRTNEKITDGKIIKDKNGEIYAIEFNFISPDLWSDLEIWLNDSETDEFIDYAKMNLSRRNKMQFTKG